MIESYKHEHVFFAYKGGTIERDLLDSLCMLSCNLEVFGCQKYEDLLKDFSLPSRCCDQHSHDVKHCSRYEVCVFSFFIRNKLDMYRRKENIYRSMYHTV